MSEYLNFYRYEATRYTNGMNINKSTYVVVKETPKGYWIRNRWSIYSKKRWIHKTAKKRWAYPTEEEAMNNFIHRKKRYIEILKYRLQDAEESLRVADSLGFKKMDELISYREMEV